MSAGPGPGERLRIDEKVLGAGTGPRFVALLLLMLTAGGSMILEVFRVLADGDVTGCALAAGVDPADGSYWNTSLSISGQGIAFRSCLSLWAPAPPWWQLAGWPLLLMVMAGLLFAVLPRWKARRSRVVPLESVDTDGEVLDELSRMCAERGVTPLPRLVVDPAAASVSAVVFGRTRRPVVCLHGGLLVVRNSDPKRFRAVLLHELAHIANRDVTLTYLTVALWRVFLALVLLPYVLCLAYVMYGVAADGGVPRLDRAAALSVVMVVLLYLARSDTLRSREIYADLTAVGWGADPHGWSVTDTPQHGAARRALDSFLELWRTHPRWGLRQGALADPAPLFRVAVLPLFLLGTVPVMAVPQVLRQIGLYRVNFTNNLMVILVVVPGALVAGVIVIALWRAVAYALLTGSRVPSGAWAGGWLGAGMSVGLVLSGFGAGWAWSPARPWVLLVPVTAGAAFGWWVTQCARLWIGTSRGRTLRPALALCAAVASLTMTAWLTWWLLAGATNLNRDVPSAQMMARSVLQWLPSSDPAGDLSKVPGIATVLPQLNDIADTPMGALVITLLWALPLLAWAKGPAAGSPDWEPTRAALREEPVASLRTVVRPGLAGGALACLAVVGIQAYVHTGQPVPEARGGLYALRYTALLLLALCLPATLAAAAAASTADRRYRLLSGLIAGQTAALSGLAAMTLLVSVDGCITPLDVLSDSCAWRPAWRRPLFPFTFVLNNALVLSALAAVLTALVTGVLHRRRPPDARVTGPADARTRGTRAQLLVVGLLCAAAVAATATDGAVRRYQLGLTTDALTHQRNLVQNWGLPDPRLSEATRLRQIRAWYRLQGDDLIDAAILYDHRLTAALRAAQADEDRWGTLYRQIPSVCRDWETAAWFEAIWFRVPAEPSVRADWHQMVTWADTGSRRCTQALDARDNKVLASALHQLRAAAYCAESVNARIDGMLREGGYRGTSRPAATGSTAVCHHTGQDPAPDSS
ncbi:M56 family metallopeptidase [Streptomyces sp. NPDC005791]|uniref:M56 family metallopeptidase n=1 Tax=Streptomyces sp. NPDC005791 TaxID=3364732 RepID=UPI0036B69D88